MKQLGLIALPLSVGLAACGDILAEQQPILDQPERVEVALPGFEVQHLYQIPLEEQGSWVSLALGPDGDLYASDQADNGIFRIRVGGDIDNPEVTISSVPVDVTNFQGMDYAFGYLYGNRTSNQPGVGGLHRLSDSDEDGEFDTVEYLGVALGSGEHGQHGVMRTGDGEGLYMVGGNTSFMLDNITRNTLSGWEEDHLLPRDAVGHARTYRAPGGFILRTSPDGQEVTVFSMGYRNSYAGAVNQHGELFVYDSDLEYDMALPWYRQTNVIHVVSGGDYGWRQGTGVHPQYNEDYLPAIAEIGPGSPTGVIMGTGARFPARYQNALYVLDWTYSTIFAVHLTPNGASYDAEFEEFVAGNSAIDNSLQVTDAEIGADGHLYFLTGGRNTPGDIWRVVYRGTESVEPAQPVDTPQARAARELRHSLERFHGVQDPAAVNEAWPHLSSRDRFLRHAARVAIEAQPVETWANRALSESNSQARIAGIVALARTGSPDYREAATGALLGLPLAQLTTDEKLGMLRAFALVFMRLGDPTEAERTQIRQALNALLPDPGQSAEVNHELIRVLVYLRDDQVTAKAMALMRAVPPPSAAPAIYQHQRMLRSGRYSPNALAIIENPPPTEAFKYAWLLRTQREGWTAELRREYFEFADFAAQFRGGQVYAGQVNNMRMDALRNTLPEHREAVADLTGVTFVYEPGFQITPPRGPGGNWSTQQTIQQAMQPLLTGRNLESGRNLFFATGCASCHIVAGLGSDFGPNLSESASWQVNLGRIAEKLANPDQVIEVAWMERVITLADGRTIVGLPPLYTGDRAAIRPKDIRQPVVEVAASEIVSVRRVDGVSSMPGGLVTGLNAQELADLIAFVQSNGDPGHEAYGPAAPPAP